MSGGVLISRELANVLQQMAREWQRKTPSTKPQRAHGPARMQDYSIELGKVDADVTAGNSVAVSIYRGTTKGSETDTGDNVTAYLRESSLAEGAWCYVFYVNGGWEIFFGDPCWEAP